MIDCFFKKRALRVVTIVQIQSLLLLFHRKVGPGARIATLPDFEENAFQ